MEASAVLEQAAAAGLTLRAEGERLIVKGPLPDGLRGLLREHKDAILQALRQPPASASESWDTWDPAHAGNMLALALAEVEAHSLEHGLLPTEQSRARCLDLMEAVDVAEGDMPRWRAAVAALKETMLTGLVVRIGPQAVREMRRQAAITAAFWRDADLAGGGDAAAVAGFCRRWGRAVMAEGREQGVAG